MIVPTLIVLSVAELMHHVKCAQRIGTIIECFHCIHNAVYHAVSEIQLLNSVINVILSSNNAYPNELRCAFCIILGGNFGC